jgi:xanthine dehydrogenase accessory factor
VGWHLGQLAPQIGRPARGESVSAAVEISVLAASAEQIVVPDLPGWLDRTEIPSTAYIVALTSGPRHDYDAVRALADREFRYVGLIGSRAKLAQLVERALAEGVSPDWLRAIHSPVGLDIGAVTPEEIAVSIVAELIAVRRGKLDGAGGAASLQWTSPRLREHATR